MYRFSLCISNTLFKMANAPVSARRKSKQYPLDILMSMGHSNKRALKALTATGDNGVQLAADWLAAHVNDPYIDKCLPREYTLHAHPTGPLLMCLNEFWQKSRNTCGWNGAHDFPPHITLVSFFKAPDELSFHIGSLLKQCHRNIGLGPSKPLQLEPNIALNCMGLIISEEYNKYFKSLATQFIKQVSNLLQTNLDNKLKSSQLILASEFEESAYNSLKTLVENLDVNVESDWEIRLYSADARFVEHKVYKVIQDYTPTASDELELVVGDLIYIEEKHFDSSPDGWVHGTSWLTGVSGRLLRAHTTRTADSDAWTLHEVVPIGKDFTKKMSSGAHPRDGAEKLGHEKSEESYREWAKYWDSVANNSNDGIIRVTQGPSMDWQPTDDNGDAANSTDTKNGEDGAGEDSARWVFAMRHGERVDLTYGPWTDHCFDWRDQYVRKDLNMPLELPKRAGGAAAYARDTPLTRVGRLQARLVGEALRLAGAPLAAVYASSALRCVETAQHLLEGLEAGPSVKIRVEPGLFEYKQWHLAKGVIPFMTPLELHLGGYNVDLDYKPYVELDTETSETVEELYLRNEKVMRSALKDAEAEGGNVMFVGHAATLDLMVAALAPRDGFTSADYQISRNLLRVPYCALAALRGRPPRLVPPPCPPSINSSSGRFNWKILLDLYNPQ